MPGELNNAVIIGGAAVKITGDISALEASEKQARSIVGFMRRLQVTIPISLDLAGLERQVQQAMRIVQPLRALQISGGGGGGGYSVGGGGRVETVSDRIERSADDRREATWAVRSFRAARRKQREGDSARDDDARRAEEDQERADGGEARWAVRSFRAARRRIDRADNNWNRIIAGDRLTRDRMLVDLQDAADREGQNADANGGGGGARGGLGRGNLFSLRGLGRVVGNTTTAFVAAETLRAVGSLIQISREQSHPDRILQDQSRAGELRDPLHDGVLQKLATQQADITAATKRLQFVNSVPVLGWVTGPLDNALGASDQLQQQSKLVSRQAEAHQVSLQRLDAGRHTMALRSGDPGADLRVTANEESQKAYSLYSRTGFYDSEAFDAYQNTMDIVAGDRAMADRLTRGKGVNRFLVGAQIGQQGRAIVAAGKGDVVGEYNASRGATLAGMKREFQNQEDAIANDDDRSFSHSQNQRTIENYNAETAVGVRQRRTSLFNTRALIGSDIRLDANRIVGLDASGNRNSISGFDSSRAVARQNLVDDRQAKINEELNPEVKQKLKDQLASNLKVFDKDTQVQRKLTAEQQEADTTRIWAKAGADRLQITHQTFAAEMELLRAEGDAKLKVADASQKAAVAASNKAEQDLAVARENERLASAATSDSARVRIAGYRVQRDPFRAELAGFDADAENELRSKSGIDWFRTKWRQQAERGSIVADQKFQIQMQTDDLQAREASANQSRGGQRVRAGYTPRIQAGIDEVKLAAPELRAQTKQTVIAEMEAMKSELTGMHGGAIVSGSNDLGQVQGQIFQARYRRKETEQIIGDINAGEAKVRAWNGNPNGGSGGPGDLGPLKETVDKLLTYLDNLMRHGLPAFIR